MLYVQLSMFMLHAVCSCPCSRNIDMLDRHGHAAWAWTRSMCCDMQHGHRRAAWTWICNISQGRLLLLWILRPWGRTLYLWVPVTWSIMQSTSQMLTWRLETFLAQAGLPTPAISLAYALRLKKKCKKVQRRSSLISLETLLYGMSNMTARHPCLTNPRGDSTCKATQLLARQGCFKKQLTPLSRF